MNIYEVTQLLNIILNFSVYFIFAFMGSFFKEIHLTNSIEDHDFQPHRIIIGTVVGDLSAIAIYTYFNEFLSQYWGLMSFISFVLGIIGYELFGYLSSISGITKLIKIVTGKSDDNSKA